MNITRTTLEWYRQKVEPKWAKQVIDKERKVNIDAVINSQCGFGKDVDKNYVSHNLMNLCRHYRKRGVLLEELWRVAHNPGTIIEPRKRAALAKKWAKRIEKQRSLIVT